MIFIPWNDFHSMSCLFLCVFSWYSKLHSWSYFYFSFTIIGKHSNIIYHHRKAVLPVNLIHLCWSYYYTRRRILSYSWKISSLRHHYNERCLEFFSDIKSRLSWHSLKRLTETLFQTFIHDTLHGPIETHLSEVIFFETKFFFIPMRQEISSELLWHFSTCAWASIPHIIVSGKIYTWKLHWFLSQKCKS